MVEHTKAGKNSGNRQQGFKARSKEMQTNWEDERIRKAELTREPKRKTRNGRRFLPSQESMKRRRLEK